MATKKLEKSKWQGYFDRVSQGIGATLVEIEIAGLTLGDQVEAQWVPLTGMSYDPKDDLFLVMSEELDHLISNPRDIYVDDDVEGLRNVEVIDADGNRQIIQLKPPLALPSL
jgi:hypothetical protein